MRTIIWNLVDAPFVKAQTTNYKGKKEKESLAKSLPNDERRQYSITDRNGHRPYIRISILGGRDQTASRRKSRRKQVTYKSERSVGEDESGRHFEECLL